MNLIDFLEHQDLRSLVLNYTVIIIKGEDEYPLLFFMRFLKYIRESLDIPLEMVDVREQETSVLKGKFETSFLGLNYIFYLKSWHELDDKKKKQWISYLNTYAGPNILMFYDSQELVLDQAHILSIQLPASVDNNLMSRLAQSFKCKPSQAGSAMLNRMFKRYPSIGLDQASSIMFYAPLISSGNSEQIDEFVDALVGAEQSLFTLSTLFFAKQREAFFKMWSYMHDSYPEVFWITFWSEQVWRAAFYITYVRARNMAEAKKISFRLPFSFMQKDWKLYSQSELVAAHQFLYTADHALKNGNESPLIELFYLKFFEGSFKQHN
jgi:hypothetical protein